MMKPHFVPLCYNNPQAAYSFSKVLWFCQLYCKKLLCCDNWMGKKEGLRFFRFPRNNEERCQSCIHFATVDDVLYPTSKPNISL